MFPPVSLGLIRPNWVLLGCTGSYWFLVNFEDGINLVIIWPYFVLTTALFVGSDARN